MKLYLIKGMVYFGNAYKEQVHVATYEEKPKSYVREGKRVDKKRIGVLEESITVGNYQMYVLDEKDILDARVQVMEASRAYWLEKNDEIQQRLAAIDTYQFPDDHPFVFSS